MLAEVGQEAWTDGMVKRENLSFVAADLVRDDGWKDAVTGVDFVLHVASPVHPGHVENADDLIVPVREGTLRVLRAARDAMDFTRSLRQAVRAARSGGKPSVLMIPLGQRTNV